MPLRDLLLFGFVFLSLPVCLARPFFGLLMWTWISFMNPHRLAWGAAYGFPFALLVGSTLLLGFAFSREPKRIPHTLGTYGLAALAVCMTLSTLNAHNWADAQAAWGQRLKILLILFLMMALVRDRSRLWMLTLVTAGSVAFYGVKGGIFAIITGGHYNVLGPARSALAGNNHLAVGLNMVLPLLWYLAKDAEHRSLRRLLQLAFLLCVVAVIATYSRGGMIGLAAVTLALFVKTGHRLLAAVLLALSLLALVSFAPERWAQRMDTIRYFSVDGSAMGRLNAWRLAWRLALERPLLGWGPEAMEDKTLYDRFYPDSPTRNDAHSAYFQVLSEGGFPAFFIWLLIGGWTLTTLQRLSRRFGRDPPNAWVASYADMFQISVIGYLASAAFLEMGFFDLYFHMVACTIVLWQIARTIESPQKVPGALPGSTRSAGPAAARPIRPAPWPRVLSQLGLELGEARLAGGAAPSGHGAPAAVGPENRSKRGIRS